MKKNRIKYPGVILLLWAIISCVVAIFTSLKLAPILGISDSGKTMGILIGIIAALLITPVTMILRKDLNQENQKIFEKRIRKLITQNKYSKAINLFEKNTNFIQKSETLLNLKKEVEEKISQMNL